MERFRYPGLPKYVAFTLIPLLVFLAVAIFTTLVLDNAQPGSVLMATIIAVTFLFLAFLQYKKIKREDISFIVSESGLLMQSRKGDLSINWAEIGGIRSRDILRRLVLVNRAGEHVINIYFELNGFNRLREILLSRVTQLNTDNQTVFATSIYVRFNLIVFTLIMFYVAIRSALSGMTGDMCIFGGIAILSVFAYLWEIKSIRIEQDKVVIKSALRVYTVSFQDISDVILCNSWSSRSIWYTKLIIERNRDKPIELFRLQGGAIPLYRSLHKIINLSLPRLRNSYPERGAEP